MTWPLIALGISSMLLSVVLTRVVIALGHRAGTFDAEGVPGQIKARTRRVPNTGGIAVFGAILLPSLASLGIAWLVPNEASWLPLELTRHLPGIRAETPLLITFLAGAMILHILGLVDDRRPIPWKPKMLVMLGIPLGLALMSDTRLLSFLDPLVGGSWLSIVITVLWFATVTNAMNFLDNMDGLSAGVAAVSAAMFSVSAILGGEWFVAAGLVAIVGSCVGFLTLNFPRFGSRPASVFMGDGGSLVLGYCLAFLTTRATFYDADTVDAAWYASLMPLIVLAIPLYDLVSVTAVRLSQGRSPFVGDLQHLSHRLVRRGLSKRSAVMLIWMLTAITSVGGISLRSLEDWQAILVAGQTLLLLAALAIFERSSSTQLEQTSEKQSHETPPA